MMEFKLEDSDFRAIALCQFKLGRRVAETCRDMVAAFGKEAPAERTVQKWYLEFQREDMNLNDAHLIRGMTEMNDAAPIYFPFGNRYDEIDKRYRFTQRTDLKPLASNYPPRSRDPMNAKFGDREAHAYQQKLFKANVAPSGVEAMSRSDIFPDVVIMTIFKYMHPVDLINGVSGISRRWNKLANSPSNYTSVRVIIDEDSVATGSAKAFLQRGTNCIRRLCLNYTKSVSEGCVADILPECMPNVTLLDISFFADLETNVDALIRCFPNVEILIMENLANVYAIAEDEKSITKLFSENAFPRVRRLYFSASGFDDRLMGKLLSWKRSIEVLRLLHVDEATFFGLQRAPFIPTLTELYVESIGLTNSAFARIGHLTNLKKLSICIGYDARDGEVLQLKNLYNLEHVHMFCSGEDSDHGRESVLELFRLPDRKASNYFPYRLKYLRISNDPGLIPQVLDELGKSCPDLLSLNVSYGNFMFEDAFSMIARRFKKLRFLESNGIDGSFDVLRNLSDDDLPDLQFLALRNTPVSEGILGELSKQRPNLIICDRTNYFINGVIHNGKMYVNKEFVGDIDAILNDLSEIDGFCCMSDIRSEF